MTSAFDGLRRPFLRDLVAGMQAHRYRTSSVIWPENGEEVAEQLAAAAGDPPELEAIPLADELAARLGCPVTTRFASPPLELSSPAETVVLTIRGSCHVVAGENLAMRLLAGETIYQPAGRSLKIGESHGSCVLLVMTLGEPAPEAV
jgi:hypothetical protein